MVVQLTINEKPVQAPEESTLLEAARENGIRIPTLCYHKDLSPVGSCRLCLVEVDGWRGEVASCTLPISEGMLVRTDTPAIRHSRRMMLSLLLQNYRDAGYQSHNGDETEFSSLVREYDAQVPDGFRGRARYPVDSDPNPFIWVDLNKCILCTRCVRACEEIQGRFVWSVAQRGADARIVAGADMTMLDARCESCGACVAYCPTGALDNRMMLGLFPGSKRVTTTCSYCGVGCQFDLHVNNGKVVGVTSQPEAPVNGMHLCVKGRYGYDYIHHPERLTRPRVRRYLLEHRDRKNGERGDWVEVDWDTALHITSQQLLSFRDQSGPNSVGVLTSAKCLNEENYLMNKFARQIIGTNNIDHCARL